MNRSIGQVLGVVLPLVVVHKHFHSHSLRQACRGSRRNLGCHLSPFGFVSPVLEPYFHLRLGELEGSGQVRPFWSGQVTLQVKAPLQLVHLCMGEGSTGSFLARFGAVVCEVTALGLL